MDVRHPALTPSSSRLLGIEAQTQGKGDPGSLQAGIRVAEKTPELFACFLDLSEAILANKRGLLRSTSDSFEMETKRVLKSKRQNRMS